MSFGSLLRHTVTIKRVTLGSVDEFGQPSQTWNDLATVRALIQPRAGRTTGGLPEELNTSGTGAQITDHIAFMRVTDVTAADRLVESGRTFQIMQVRDGGGQDHHLEVDCRLIEPEA
jgi:head-tail adaptor